MRTNRKYGMDYQTVYVDYQSLLRFSKPCLSDSQQFHFPHGCGTSELGCRVTGDASKDTQSISSDAEIIFTLLFNSILVE